MRASVSGASQISRTAASTLVPARCSRVLRRPSALHLGHREGGRRQRRKAFRDANRPLEQLIRRDDLVDEPACAAILRRVGRAAEDLLEMLGRGGEAHDLERHGGKRHADEELGDADASGVLGHQPPVGRAGEHAAAGDRVAVERGHHRLRMEEHRLERLAHHREELAQIGGPAGDRALEIDAGGKDPLLPCQHDGIGGCSQLPEPLDDAVAQLAIQGIGLAVPHGEDGDAPSLRELDHATLLFRLPGAARTI